MIKVKTFSNEIKIFHTMNQISELDDAVNSFLSENGIKDVISVSDCATTDDSGKTIGVIRSVAYRA